MKKCYLIPRSAEGVLIFHMTVVISYGHISLMGNHGKQCVMIGSGQTKLLNNKYKQLHLTGDVGPPFKNLSA